MVLRKDWKGLSYMNYSYVREIVKGEWHDLWQSKREDEIVAESISLKKYTWLEIEKGEIVRDSRHVGVDLHSILQRNYGIDEAARINPDPAVGGYGKFVKENLSKRRPSPREAPRVKVDLSQPQRKGGKGWINQMRISRKIRESEQ